jgi:hypothetical protein
VSQIELRTVVGIGSWLGTIVDIGSWIRYQVAEGAAKVIDKRINKGMLSEGIAERKIPHTEKPPEAWP